jgi:hypothetical protein
MSYKKWKEPWRLHAKECDDNWDTVNEPSFKWKVLGSGIFILALALYSHPSKAYESVYNFPFGDITMDVVKQDRTGGGTIRCPTLQACYTKVLRAEARGATQYCESITIKRGGKVMWQRYYQLEGGI